MNLTSRNQTLKRGKAQKLKWIVACVVLMTASALANDSVLVINPTAKPVPVTVTSGGITVTPTGAAHIANGQVTTSTVAGTAVAARATRRSVCIKNTDATITVYIGIATVTAGNGLPLKPGESIPIDSTALIQVIAASGSPVVAYMETYD